MFFKMCLVFALMLALLHTSFAAVFRQEITEDPSNAGKCYFSKGSGGGGLKTYFTDDGYDTDSCIKYSCSKTATPGKFLVLGYTCSPVEVKKPSCYVTNQTTGRYPDCCPQAVCT